MIIFNILWLIYRGQNIPTNVANVELDLPVDPNEPTYCYCGQVSYGEMIACDNSEVRASNSSIIVEVNSGGTRHEIKPEF